MEGVLCSIIRILLMKKESVDGLKKSGTVQDFWFRIVGCVPKRKWENDW